MPFSATYLAQICQYLLSIVDRLEGILDGSPDSSKARDNAQDRKQPAEYEDRQDAAYDRAYTLIHTVAQRHPTPYPGAEFYFFELVLDVFQMFESFFFYVFNFVGHVYKL